MSLITSGLTRAPTSSMKETAAKVEDPARRGRRADGDRQQPVARVAHLAEAPDAVADRGEHQRGGAHRGARGQVEQEAGGEAHRAAGDAARVVAPRRPR